MNPVRSEIEPSVSFDVKTFSKSLSLRDDYVGRGVYHYSLGLLIIYYP